MRVHYEPRFDHWVDQNVDISATKTRISCRSLSLSASDPTTAFDRLALAVWLSYLRQGGYVIVVVCLSVCLCLLATLRKNFRPDLHEIFREGWHRTNEQTVKLWWRSGSGTDPNPYRDTGSALAEVRTVPVLLVD